MFIASILLAVILLAAALLDLASRRIPNWLTYPSILCGLALAFVQGGVPLLLNHLLAVLAVGLPMLALFLSGTLGGGDVKLMAAVGAFLGFPLAFNALISTFMVGGLIALLVLIWRGRLFSMTSYAARFVGHRMGLIAAAPEPPTAQKTSLAFGTAIALGTWAVMIPPDLLVR